MKRQKSSHNSFLEIGGGEWLIGEAQAGDIILRLLSDLSIPRAANILIPGVGKSTMYLSLTRQGYTNITLTDIEDVAIDFQNELITRCHLEDRVRVIDVKMFSPKGKFRVVIDKSFLDVFLRQGGSRRMMNDIHATMSPDGVFLAISMFHRSWTRLLGPRFNHIAYQSIGTPSYNNGKRPRKRITPISVIVASNHDPVEHLVGFTDIRGCAFPPLTADDL